MSFDADSERVYLFFSVAPHQARFFHALTEHAGVRAEVMSVRDILTRYGPFARSAVDATTRRQIVEEKLEERRRKGKFGGGWMRVLIDWELRWVGAAITRLIRGHDRSLVIGLWNGGHRYHRLIRALQTRLGFDIRYFENGPLPNSLVIDAKGVNQGSSLPRDASFYRAYRAGEGFAPAELPVRGRKSRRELPAPVAVPDRYVFVPFQDDNDTQIRCHSPWIRDMRALFDAMAQVAHQTGVPVVLREHPSSRFEYPDLHRRADEHIFFANGNELSELIRGAEAVVTVNSTVGFEALVLGTPVITLGQSFYTFAGLTRTAMSMAELLDSVDSPLPVDRELVDRYFAYLRDEYLVPYQRGSDDPVMWRRIRERLVSA